MAVSPSQPTNAPAAPALSVLGYQEDGEWVALALEMDLRGYGATLPEAMAELQDLVAMQIGFARFKGQPQLIGKPAEPTYWRLFEDARRNRLEEIILDAPPRNPSFEAGGMPLPGAHEISALAPSFEQQHTEL